MPIEPYRWNSVTQFRDRARELAVLEQWWESDSPEPLSLSGRRRVGKSWLFRKFAHGKPAVILVAEQVAIGDQLGRLADDLTAVFRVTPRINDVAGLVTMLYDLAEHEKILVVIDEFPYLLGSSAAEQRRTLSIIQAIMERKRDSSRIKLMITGSAIATMESLGAERNPLHGRLRPLVLRPMPFADATQLLDGIDPVEQLTRFAIAGGMPRYLSALAHGDLTDAVTRAIVDPDGPLFNEPLTLLQAELREPAVYFSILSALSGAPQSVAGIASKMRSAGSELSRYLDTLETLRLIRRRKPVGAKPAARATQWGCTDHFLRFWFRFIQPHRSELEAGIDPTKHTKHVIMPNLADHCAPVFEEVVATWLRGRHPGATAVGGWWGPALNPLRRAKERFTEEIDTVALQGRTVVAVAEAKWTTKPMDADVLTDLVGYKIPALDQAGLHVTSPQIVLASKSGFSSRLEELAGQKPNVTLVPAAMLLRDLAGGTAS